MYSTYRPSPINIRHLLIVKAQSLGFPHLWHRAVVKAAMLEVTSGEHDHWRMATWHRQERERERERDSESVYVCVSWAPGSALYGRAARSKSSPYPFVMRNPVTLYTKEWTSQSDNVIWLLRYSFLFLVCNHPTGTAQALLGFSARELDSIKSRTTLRSMAHGDCTTSAQWDWAALNRSLIPALECRLSGGRAFVHQGHMTKATWRWMSCYMCVSAFTWSKTYASTRGACDCMECNKLELLRYECHDACACGWHNVRPHTGIEHWKHFWLLLNSIFVTMRTSNACGTFITLNVFMTDMQQ